MAQQPFCSYEELGTIVPILTADSTTPVGAEDLNPLIERFHTRCLAPIQAIGGHSALLSTSDGVAAKISFRAGDERLRIEQDSFAALHKSPSPYIIRSFLSRPDITFMPFISSRNLHDRITMGSVSRPVFSWIFQLSSALATLETLSYAHGDIKPNNILVDDRDNITVIDLDHTIPVGSGLDVGEEPYVRARLLGEDGLGVYGSAGPETEQFALGSIFWYITRGEELYAELDGVDRVNRLADRQFPDLSPEDPIDSLIRKCWSGKFEQMADLLREVRRLATEQGALDSIVDAPLLSSSEYTAKQELCEYYYSLLLPEQDTSRREYVQRDSTDLGWRRRILYAAQSLKEGFRHSASVQPILAVTATVGTAMILAAYLQGRR